MLLNGTKNYPTKLDISIQLQKGMEKDEIEVLNKVMNMFF